VFTLWPESTRKGRVRAVTLLVLLSITTWTVYALLSFNPGAIYLRAMTSLMGARIFQEIIPRPASSDSTVTAGDSSYGSSSLDEVKIQACEQYIRLRKSMPSSLDELAQVGLGSEFYFDPWKRRYRVRLLPGGRSSGAKHRPERR